MPAKRKPTAADAQLILQLYDLRREGEMRKARNFVAADFWPEGFEDIRKILMAYPSSENNWLRQVAGYWDMAASLVLHGTLHEGLFLEASGEMYNLYAKFRPFLKQMREEFKAPEALANVEKVVLASRQSRERLKRMEERIAFRRQMSTGRPGPQRA